MDRQVFPRSGSSQKLRLMQRIVLSEHNDIQSRHYYFVRIAFLVVANGPALSENRYTPEGSV